MMDDVMGLVMVQIISNLGGGNGGSSGFDPVIVIRPILVAFGFAIGLLLICRFGVARAVHFSLAGKLHYRFPDVVKSSNFAFVAHMGVLIGLVAGATYAGTSGLFAAYLAGVGISWFDELLATATSTGSATEGTESSGIRVKGTLHCIVLHPHRTNRPPSVQLASRSLSNIAKSPSSAF